MGPQGPRGDVGPAGKDGTSVVLILDAPTSPCAAGGSLLRDGAGRDTWVCNGVPGPKGDTGLTGATGPQGPRGDTGLTGPQGASGANGSSVVMDPEATGNPCKNGGVLLRDTATTATSWICSGERGPEGKPGTAVVIVAEATSSPCKKGGTLIRDVGAEVDRWICDGVDGAPGLSSWICGAASLTACKSGGVTLCSGIHPEVETTAVICNGASGSANEEYLGLCEGGATPEPGWNFLDPDLTDGVGPVQWLSVDAMTTIVGKLTYALKAPAGDPAMRVSSAPGIVVLGFCYLDLETNTVMGFDAIGETFYLDSYGRRTVTTLVSTQPQLATNTLVGPCYLMDVDGANLAPAPDACTSAISVVPPPSSASSAQGSSGATRSP